MREDRIYSIMKNELKRDNKITVYGRGERISNFVSIDYLVKKMDKILNNKKIEGTYNLGEKNLSYKYLAEMIIKKYGDNSSKVVLKQNGVKSKVIIDSSKIEKL